MHMFVMIEEVSWELKLMEGLYGFSYMFGIAKIMFIL